MVSSVVVPIFDKKTKVYVVIRCKLMNISQCCRLFKTGLKFNPLSVLIILGPLLCKAAIADRHSYIVFFII